MEFQIEELEDNNTLVSLAEQFENDVPQDSYAINCKWNFDDGDDADNAVKDCPFHDMREYIKSLGCDILFSSAGYHLKGESHHPHVHYHFITTPFKIPSNPSQHKTRYANKNEALGLIDVSIKFHTKLEKGKPKYQVLSYPLKEGHEIKHCRRLVYVYNSAPMTKTCIQFLKEVGNAIYESSLALNLRKDKCQERKKVALNELYELCEANKEKFSTFQKMMLWLDNEYIAKLQLDEYPDPKHYKTNCQKIAVYLGKLKYSDIL